jgi:sortase (surface protein transpeptidase)
VPLAGNSQEGEPIIKPAPEAPIVAEQPAQQAPEVPTAPVQRHIKPSRIVIESIGVDYQPVPVDSSATVLDHDVAWFNQSAGPGEGENIVFWAHVLRFTNAPNIPAPFADVQTLPIGTQITVYDAGGVAHYYAVKDKIEVTPDQSQYMYEYGREAVTLISCIGDNVIGENGGVVDKTHRLITIAEPV